MKQQETTQKTIGENTFYIRPVPAFRAANISGELVKILSPAVGAIASAVGVSGANAKDAAASVMDMDIDEVAPKLGDAFSGLSGDSIERLMKKLLIESGNISVEGPTTNGDVKVMDLDIANEVFCAEIQDMFILCFEVVKVNFRGFFSKIADRFGGLLTASGAETESSDTAI